MWAVTNPCLLYPPGKMVLVNTSRNRGVKGLYNDPNLIQGLKCSCYLSPITSSSLACIVAMDFQSTSVLLLRHAVTLFRLPEKQSNT